MVIGIDASAWLKPNKTGVEIATIDLITAILALDSDNTYWLYSPAPLRIAQFNSERVKNIVVPGRFRWTQWHLSRALKKNPPNIFWSPSHILPNVPVKTKCVTTVHDLAWYLYPKSYSWKERLLSWWGVKKAIKKSAHFIAVSQQTKKDLKRYFRVPGENIAVVYHALRSDWHNIDPDFSLASELGQYLLCVGRIELRKNIPNLLRAFAEFTVSHPSIKLVLAGNPGYGYSLIIKRLIKRLKIEPNITMLNYVSVEQLFGLYQRALGVVFPSQYEGFGLTILEGFASKVPVLTSKIGAMQEIAGEAALLVDPESVDDINLGLHRLVDDPNLRQALVERGERRLQDFSWEASAHKIINLWKII